MNDTISRQAAIDALGEKPLAWEQGEYEEGLQAQWESDVEAIKALPPAQLKRGKWIVKDDTERFIAQCNCCRYIEDSRRIKNFCPNCGADMRKEVKI